MQNIFHLLNFLPIQYSPNLLFLASLLGFVTGFQSADPLWPEILGFSLRTSSKIFEMIYWGFSDSKGLRKKSRTWISGPKIMTPYLHWLFCLWLINLMSTNITKNTFASFVFHLDVGNSLLNSALLVLLLPYFRVYPVGRKQSHIMFPGVSSRHWGLLSQRSYLIASAF